MRGDAKLKIDGQAVRRIELEPGRTKFWAKRTLSRERITVTIAKLAVTGYMGTVLAYVVQTY